MKKRNGYMKTHLFVAPLVRFFCCVKSVGLENIPEDGGYILCSNHIAVRDVLLIGAACPRQVKFIAKKELFSVPVIGWIIKKFGAVSVDRGGNDVGAIRTAVRLTKEGDLVAIFPQGHRYPGKEPGTTPYKNGAGLIAYKSGADVIPVCLKTKKARYAPFRKVEVIFGKPIKFESFNFVNGGTEEYAAATAFIMSEIARIGGYNLPSSKKEDEA